jgi:hypothetical protein
MGLPESDDSPEASSHSPEAAAAPGESAAEPGEEATLREIALQLENDQEECWQALEALASVDLDVRLSIIEELSRQAISPGALALLRLLSSARDPVTRAAAGDALAKADVERFEPLRPEGRAPSLVGSEESDAHFRGIGESAERTGMLEPAPERLAPRVVRCLVGPVDGRGRGSIVISVNRMRQRRTAAFLCDVQLGICDVVGEVEPESPWAGSLLDQLEQQPEADGARDVPELAKRLLAGSLMLCGATVKRGVRHWLDGTLGHEFQPAAFPATIPGLDPSSIPGDEMPARARALLEACPSWLDVSPLTFELAEEICLREGRPTALPDPDRDAGLFRFLFEHRLIHRLELYRRMLLWMACLWNGSGRVELAKSALGLASQLSDEQYAVPSHPFALELTTRSLKAAQSLLHTALDPRWKHGRAKEAKPI